MFNFSFKNKKLVSDLAEEIVSKTEGSLHQQFKKQNDQLEHIQLILSKMMEKVDNLEKRLDTKEIRDKKTYGHLQYKIAELQTDLHFDPKKLDNEV